MTLLSKIKQICFDQKTHIPLQLLAIAVILFMIFLELQDIEGVLRAIEYNTR